MTKSIITTILFLKFGVCLSQSNTISPLAYKEPPLDDYVYVDNNLDHTANNAHYESIKLELVKKFLLASKPRINKDNGINETIDIAQPSLKANNLLFNPLQGKKVVITSKFGFRNHPVTGKFHFHNGIDLHCYYEPLYAVIDGFVKVGEDSRSGKYIAIENPDTKIRVTYCHLSSIMVKDGDYISTGKGVGVSGNSGYSTGPHLHFSVKVNGMYIDPTRYLDLAY